MDTSTKKTNDFSIESTFIPKVSFALSQNSVPIILELAIQNNGQATWENLILTLHADPPFFHPRSWQLSKIAPEQRCLITDLELALDEGQLFRLTESEKGQATFELTQGDCVLERQVLPVELLARNQWGGLGQYPELTAAFVRPNDPAVEQI